jgi:hypothetical protein
MWSYILDHEEEFDVTGSELPTASETAWREFLAKFPKGEKFRTRKLRNFDELEDLYFGKEATGRYARLAMRTLHKRPGSPSPSLSPLPQRRKRQAPAPETSRKRQER